VWPWELRVNKGGKEKWTKPPRQARDPKHNARSNDPATWGSYDDAVAAVAAGNADGFGYMLLGSGVGAVDLDHVLEEDGKPIRWAEQLCAEAAAAYQERTVSGAGLRIIGTTSGPETHRKLTFDRKTGAGIELYRDTARYITVFGPGNEPLCGPAAAGRSDRHAARATRFRPEGQRARFQHGRPAAIARLRRDHQKWCARRPAQRSISGRGLAFGRSGLVRRAAKL
jgi:hypothetical protein